MSQAAVLFVVVLVCSRFHHSFVRRRVFNYGPTKHGMLRLSVARPPSLVLKSRSSGVGKKVTPSAASDRNGRRYMIINENNNNSTV